MNDTLLLGAVAYDPKVVTIWEGFRAFFEARDLPFDFVLYSNYERQVAAHLAGEVHVAWNSPLAWIQADRLARSRGEVARAIAMRDTDRDLTSLVVVRADGPASLEALRGKTVAVGAGDSPQATLIPLLHLAEAGLEPGVDFEVRRFDKLLGKHGDHVGGERDAARALLRGEVDACCMIDGNHLVFTHEGTLPAKSTRILATTERYDHCNFTIVEGIGDEAAIARFTELLLAMRYDDPDVRPLLDLEGLKAWMPGRLEGYALLERAVDRFDHLTSFMQAMT